MQAALEFVKGISRLACRFQNLSESKMSVGVIEVQSKRAAIRRLGPRAIFPCLIDIAQLVVSLFGRIDGGGAVVFDSSVIQAFRVEQEFSITIVRARRERRNGGRNPELPLRFRRSSGFSAIASMGQGFANLSFRWSKVCSRQR